MKTISKLNLMRVLLLYIISNFVFSSNANINLNNNSSKEGVKIIKSKEEKNIEESEYKNDILNGKHITWWENGNKKTEVDFVNGKENGGLCLWYEDGQLKSKQTMKNGKPNGLFTSWYPNGKKEIEGNSDNGFEDGEWIMWYPSGDVFLKVNFSHGKILYCSQFNEKGEIINQEKFDGCQDLYRQFFTQSLNESEPL